MRRLLVPLLAVFVVAAQAHLALAKPPRSGSAPAPAPSGDGAAAPAPATTSASSNSATATPARTPTRKGSPGTAPAGGARQTVQRESHIEFDERLVQGQTAAGAIYLFQRGESEFRSMVRMPESFRDRSVRPILPSSKPAAEKR